MYGEKAKVAVPALIDALEAVDPETRIASARALAAIGDPQALSALRDVGEKDAIPVVRKVALECLERLEKSTQPKK